MCCKQKGALSTRSGKPLELIDWFTYLESNISSTESDVNLRLVKVWNAIDRVSLIQKSDLSYRIKQDFFQVVTVPILLYGCTIWTQTKLKEKRLEENYTRMLRAVLKATHLKTAAVCPPASYLTNHPSETNKICGALLEKQGWTHQ